MNPGLLRHKITIQYNAAVDQTDTNGTPLETWQELMTLHADKNAHAGRLFYQAAAAQNETDAIFTIRYRDGIKAGMRLIHLTDTYEIKVPPVDPDGCRCWLEIHTRQVLENGG